MQKYGLGTVAMAMNMIVMAWRLGLVRDLNDGRIAPMRFRPHTRVGRNRPEALEMPCMACVMSNRNHHRRSWRFHVADKEL
jgi:hypothetical protein